jgi:hypothetical protein
MGKNNNTGDSPETGAPLDCEQWEALLADKMDGTMAPETEAAFAEHGLRCPGCGELLEQARQGQQWLKLLEEHAPAAPVHLLSKILAKTQGAGREMDFPVGAAVLPGQAHAGRWGIPFLPAAGAGMAAARGAHNARMLMTAGMAFFSVALTLSVAGVRLTSVHAAELRPQVVQANVSRSFYGTKKQVVSFYENLRLVYEVESKMHDMRRDTDQPPAQQQTAPTQTAPKAKTGGHAAAGGGPDSPDRQAPHASDGSSKHSQQVEQVVYGSVLTVSYLPVPVPAHSLFERDGSSHCTTETREIPGATSKERNRI